MKWLQLSVLFIIISWIFQSVPISQHGNLAPKIFLDHGTYTDHTLWQFLLQQHVTDEGQVDYKGFLKDRQVLESYLILLSEDQPTPKWPKNEQLSYYINLYNAYTVLLIIYNYPTESIKKIKNPWGQKLIPLHGDKISLGDLEHHILRKMDEPRIHFAINCASASCPKLSNEAYRANELESQLEKATKTFISDKNEISKGRLRLSKIFKWYKKDFLDGDIRAFINNQTEVDIAPDAAIDYLDYDWSLNGN